MYITLIFSHPQASLPTAITIFLAGFVGIITYKGWLRIDGRKFDKKLQEESTSNSPKAPEWSQ
jgi:hypothetical protein